MSHFASRKFWSLYQKLPEEIQKLADANYELLKVDPTHPSLHLKKVGRYWSVRVGLKYRALGVEGDEGIIGFWVGTHAQYDQLLK